MGHSSRRAFCETLESRRMLSASVTSIGANVNISRAAGDQSEGAIAIDPTNPMRLFALSNLEGGNRVDATMTTMAAPVVPPQQARRARPATRAGGEREREQREREREEHEHQAGGSGLFAAVSDDGGATWTTRVLGTGTDGLPASCCDPSLAFDSFGNLFVTYLNEAADGVVVLLSTDAGRSFRVLTTFSGAVDQPTVTTGPDSVWVFFGQGGSMVARGAAVTGPDQVGTFTKAQSPSASNASFGDVAIGPAGQVLIAWQNGSLSEGPSTISVSRDLDGLGTGGFTTPVVVTSTNVGIFDNIPPQNDRSVDAEVGVAFDRSGGAFSGRAYMVYTEETPNESGNTDVMLRWSIDGGANWGQAIKVNDDAGTASQFLPRLAVDPTTGAVGISWLDTRDDAGGGNDDAEVFATVATPTEGGVDLLPNFKVSAAASNATRSSNSIEFGDYTGLAFYGGTMMPVWADNSNSTNDNPSANDFDLYTAKIEVQADFIPAPPGQGPVAAFKGKGLVKGGKTYSFKVSYTDAAGVDRSSLGTGDVVVSGPNDFTQAAEARGIKQSRKGTVYTVTYRVVPTDGKWSLEDNGSYAVTLQPTQVRDLLGSFADGVSGLGAFVVQSKAAAPVGSTRAALFGWRRIGARHDQAVVDSGGLG